MSWKDLDIKQKAELIKLGVQSGIRDINQIRQLYDDNNTHTQVVDQSYNETNVRPLQGIERIKQEYGIPEEEQNKANEIIQQIENEISLEEINNQQPVQFRQFKNGGYKNKPPFEEWYKTVPIDRNDTTYYNLRKAYEELPFDQLERWRTATLEQLNNEQYHLPTVSPQSLEFLKSRNHPSIQYELDWYNSPEGKDFRDKHSLDTTGNYYRYIPKAVGGYVNKYDTGGWKEKLLSLGNYAKNYIKAKAGMIQPMFINLNDYNVQQVTKDNVSDNTLGILTNDFVEKNDNNEQRLAIDFKNTTDTKLGDHEIPLENISTYYGIEDGKLKVGPLEIFNDSTMVVPNRAKNVGKVKKVLYKPQEQTEDSQLPLYGITVDNDTVPFPIRMRGKMYLGDEQGNSSFVSGITDPKVFNDVNKFLEQNPSYPAMVDNGRFSHFILGNDLNSYIGIENPDVMYMLGITPKRKGGYISNNPTQAFSHKFGKGGFSDGKPTQTQNDLDKKVSKTYFENFPNLLKVYGTPRYNGEEKEMIENGDITGAQESRNLRGEEEAKEVKSLLNNLTQQDSMFYTPILQRVDNIFEKTYNPDEEVSTMHRVSEGKMLSSLKDALQYYPVEEFKKKHQYILNKLQEVSDEDIYKFMTTNWGMDTVQDIMNIKPKNLSLAELLIIATTIKGMDNSYAPFKHKHGGYIFPKGVFQHKFDDGGYSNTTVTPTIEDKPKVVQKGKVGWNPFNVFNRNYRGAPIYESENFGDSFRQARIDEVPVFIWNGKAYNTNLKPNPLVEAARAWDTQGDLRKIEFQKRIISDPEGTMEYFRKTFPKGEYKTMNSNWDKNIYIIDDMYKNGALGMPNNVIVKGARYDIGNQLWDYLNTTNLTYNQKLALMANSYKESMGWTTTEQNNGPAKGYYQMENEQFKNYQNWLKQDKLKDNIINETKYIIDLFENHRDELITPISANLDIEDVINNYKDAEEAYANNHRSAYVHRGYYTEDALRDWDEGDLDAAVKAMEALFEKAGKPRLEDRQKIAWLLSEMYK